MKGTKPNRLKKRTLPKQQPRKFPHWVTITVILFVLIRSHGFGLLPITPETEAMTHTQVAEASVPPMKMIEKVIPVQTNDARFKTHVRCLAKNVFYEARGTDFDEKIRIINVTMNRTKSGVYSGDICGVIMQDSQFSWTREPVKMQNPVEKLYANNKQEMLAWKQSLALAEIALTKGFPDKTEGALFYKRHEVPKTWCKNEVVLVNSQWHKYFTCKKA